jgi:hypothetical protein
MVECATWPDLHFKMDFQTKSHYKDEPIYEEGKSAKDYQFKPE